MEWAAFAPDETEQWGSGTPDGEPRYRNARGAALPDVNRIEASPSNPTGAKAL